MGWWGEQGYYISATGEQAAALVIMAEAFWRTEGRECRIFDGDYRIVDGSRVAHITRGRKPSAAGYPNRIIMTQNGPKTLQNLLAVPMSELPRQPLAGVVFPFIYSCEGIWQPLSFIFTRELRPNLPDKPWRLVTAIPFVANYAGPEWPGFGREDLGHDHCGPNVFWDLGRTYWPEGQTIPQTAVVAVMDGCNISLRKNYPSMVTAFIHFAQHQLHIACESVPNVDEEVETFRSGWEQDFQVARCFGADPERVEFWQQAFCIFNGDIPARCGPQ